MYILHQLMKHMVLHQLMKHMECLIISKHQLLSLVVPPLAFIFLCIIYPFYLVFKLVRCIFRTLSPEGIAGKVVLITGASSGIGEQLVYQYAKRGACLVLVARREKLLSQVAKKALRLGSPDVLVSCADVTKVEDCKRFIEEAVNHFGRLDHLVNNAGITSVCPFDEVNNILNCAPMMDVNFWGSIYPTHFAIPHLKKTKGKIVVVASPSGWLPAPRLSLYGASKAAVISFYESLRVELDEEITITIASPGVTESEMTRGKHLALGKSGAMEVDEQMMDGLIGTFPVLNAESCAKRIVNGIRWGETHITDPFYYGVVYLMKVVCPEIVHLMFRWIHLIKPDTSPLQISSTTSDRTSSPIYDKDDHHHRSN